jgi:orotidine-5'-phosphate decarboxylase
MRIDDLIRAVRGMKNPTALGLDTRVDYIPDDFARPYLEAGATPAAGRADAVYAFNAALLDGLREIIPCVKVQAAY